MISMTKKKMLISVARSSVAGLVVMLVALFLMQLLSRTGFEVDIRIGYLGIVKLWALWVVLAGAIVFLIPRSE
jgi:hypothetical protein